MSFLSIDKVHGDHLIDRNSVVMIPQGTVIADTNVMLGKAGGQVESVSLHMLLGRPVAEITTDKGVRMFDAATAMPLPLPLVSAGQAQAIAATAWRGAGRGDPLPVWSASPRRPPNIAARFPHGA